MYCLKCGKDTKGSQVFCESCLQVMDQHPVKPGTAINLPRRQAQSTVKKPRKRALPLEEQLALLKRRNRRLALWLTLAFLLLALALGALAFLLLQPSAETSVVDQLISASTNGYIP